MERDTPRHRVKQQATAQHRALQTGPTASPWAVQPGREAGQASLPTPRLSAPLHFLQPARSSAARGAGWEEAVKAPAQSKPWQAPHKHKK